MTETELLARLKEAAADTERATDFRSGLPVSISSTPAI